MIHLRQPGLLVPRRRPPIYHGPPSLFSGQGNSDFAQTINGARVAPHGLWLPSSINTGNGNWASESGSSDGDMTLQAGAPAYDVDSPLGVNGIDEGVKCNGNSWWAPAGTAFGDLADLKDVYIELLCLWTGGTLYVAGKASVFDILGFAAGNIRMRTTGDGGAISTTVASGMSTGALAVIGIYWNRDVNGAA
jgi:hypothetical protein